MEKNTEEWLKIFYSESWKQYIHEDSIFQSRNSMLLTLQGIFAGIIGTVCAIIGNKIFDESQSKIILGSTLVLTSILSMFLLRFWMRLTNASGNYVNLRFSNALIIETYLDLADFGLASLEKSMKENISREKKFYEAFKATKSIINLLYIFWILIFIIGISIFIYIHYLSCHCG